MHFRLFPDGRNVRGWQWPHQPHFTQGRLVELELIATLHELVNPVVNVSADASAVTDTSCRKVAGPDKSYGQIEIET